MQRRLASCTAYAMNFALLSMRLSWFRALCRQEVVIVCNAYNGRPPIELPLALDKPTKRHHSRFGRVQRHIITQRGVSAPDASLSHLWRAVGVQPSATAK